MQEPPGSSRLLLGLRLQFQVVKNALRHSHPERLGIVGLRGSLIADPIPFATAPTCGPRYSAILGPAVHINKPVNIVPNNA